MFCQSCGVEAETRQVTLHQNIGALVVRFPSSISGQLCKRCISKHFWSMTPTTFFLGWWGTISFFVTPFYLINNLARYVGSFGMPGVPHGATPPQLTDAAIERLKPHISQLVDRLNDGEDFAVVAKVIAERAGVTPGQVALLVQALAQSQRQE